MISQGRDCEAGDVTDRTRGPAGETSEAVISSGLSPLTAAATASALSAPAAIRATTFAPLIKGNVNVRRRSGGPGGVASSFLVATTSRSCSSTSGSPGKREAV